MFNFMVLVEFIIVVTIVLTIGILSFAGMLKHSKKQKKAEAEWAEFIEKHPSKNER